MTQLTLAQVPRPTMEEFWPTFITLVAILSIALLIKMLLPQRRKPPIEAEFATKKEMQVAVKNIEEKVDRIDREVRAGFQDLRKDSSSRSSNMHKRMDDLAETLRGQGTVLDLIKNNMKINFRSSSS